MMRGIPGVATKDQVNKTAEKAGELTKRANTTPQSANAPGSAPSARTGTANIQCNSGE